MIAQFEWGAGSLIVEGLVWSLAAYGAGFFVELAFRSEDIHLSRNGLFVPGLVMAAALFVMLSGGVVFFLGGSSRGHRLIIESAVVLMFGLPTTGVQLFADLNRGLDASEVNVQAKVSNCETRVSTRYRRGSRRTSTTYHLHLSGSAEGITLPSDIRVAQNVCRAAAPGASAAITLGKGAFGKPWYRRISVGGTSWSP